MQFDVKPEKVGMIIDTSKSDGVCIPGMVLFLYK